ncbi:MAG: hypothetical protein ETSY2_16125 [Candidatus Entotheonella gemina]|uniref:Uncharacterized protein n=1 Tax=Candidatus Entotheonella gemina TaxID=1429439 RepID=W4MAE0_9BACT|nr:MAG: hypothetical protein ETSY2_16125 [Candidatus Entotheonella gemina]
MVYSVPQEHTGKKKPGAPQEETRLTEADDRI